MSKQQQAINDYLQALLQDVDDEPLKVEEAQLSQQVKTLGLEVLVAEVPDAIVETATEVVTELKQEQSVEVEEQIILQAPVEVKPEVEIETPAVVEKKKKLFPTGQSSHFNVCYLRFPDSCLLCLW